MTHIENIKIFHPTKKLRLILLIGFGIGASSFTYAGFWSLIKPWVIYNNKDAPAADGDKAQNISSNKGAPILDDDKAQAISSNIALGDSNEAIGFTIIHGALWRDRSGRSLSRAGDVNADGYDDFIIGAPFADAYGKSESGVSYVVFGQADNKYPIDLGDLDASSGFQINGASVGDHSGWSVSGAGDVNGDGYDDLVIGEPGFGDFAGASYVVYGSKNGSDVNLVDFNTHAGFRINGTNNAHSGFSVSGAGDVNGDGYDDLIVGSPEVNGLTGASYVVYGQKYSLGDISLKQSDFDSSTGFVIHGAKRKDTSGWSVSGAGDINGDGYDDLVIGAPHADSEGKHDTGASYVVYGQKHRSSDVNLNDFDASTGIKIKGAYSSDQMGHSVSGAGDVNADGYDDLIIGAPGFDNLKGASYVVYGSKHGGDINLLDFSADAGFRIHGADKKDKSGFSTSSAGDVNGDGYDDVIIGAPYAKSQPGSDKWFGISYVIYGQADEREDVSLSDFGNDARAGFVITGADEMDRSGRSVSSAGDINADGYEDLLIGAPYAESAKGASYVVYGGPSDDKPLGAMRWSQAGHDPSVGSRGNDELGWTGENAVLIGGAGDDKFIIDNANIDRIDGGRGKDRLIFTSGIVLDFTDDKFERTSIKNIEAIDMSDTASTLVLRPIDVLNLSTTSDKLFVQGGSNDRLQLYHSATEITDWTHRAETNRWISNGNNAVVEVIGNVEVERRFEPTMAIDKNFNIAAKKNAVPPYVRFGESKSTAPHYLSLDDSIFNGLTELTIEMDFKLDFSRSRNRKHAYLLSLAESDRRDNMLSIFLKERGYHDKWDLSIWVQDEHGDNQKIFLHENWLENGDAGVLTVAIKFDGDGEIVVHWAPADSIDNDGFVVNDCLSSRRYHKECRGNLSAVDAISVGRGGAVFGNDQDALAGRFDHKQAFEGELYGLKVFDKFFDPSSSSARTDTGAELIYSLSPGSVQ